MVGPNAGAAGMGPGGGGGTPEPLPDIRRPDYQLLMQDLAQARRDVFEERRNGEKRVNEERDRSRWEIERIRVELNDRIKKADLENNALITALGRLREENDGLREENAILKIAKSNGHVEPKTEPEPSRPQAAPTIPQTALFKKLDVAMVPPSEPALGKTVPIDPAKLV